MEKDKLKEMQNDAQKIIAEFNAKLKEFSQKYPGFATVICDAQDVYDGTKFYSAEILGKL